MNRSNFLLLVAALSVGTFPLALELMAQEEPPASAPSYADRFTIPSQNTTPSTAQDIEPLRERSPQALLPFPEVGVQKKKSVLAAPADANSDEIFLQYPFIPISEILIDYQEYTGATIIRDATINAATVSVESPVPLTREEAASFIERSLLLNGFAMIKEADGLVKVIPFAPGRQARSEGIPVYDNIEDLPPGDPIATLIIRLNNLGAVETAGHLSQIVPSHQFGSISPVAEAGLLVVTDSATTIRRISDLVERIDIDPIETVQRTFLLERAEAENVAEAITEILDFRLGIPVERGRADTAQPIPIQAIDPTAPQTGRLDTSPEQRAVVRAITRTNSILAIARTSDMTYIEGLISEFDAPAPLQKFFSRDLQFANVLEILPVVENALLRGAEEEGGVEGSSQVGGSTSSRNAGSSQGSSLDTGISLQDPEPFSSPESIVVGKTLLVGDPVANRLSVSGPPESIEVVRELVEILDGRPRQVFISAVIGQFTLGDGMDTGLDIVRSMDDIEVNGQVSQAAGIFRGRQNSTAPILDPGILTDVEQFLPAISGLTLYGEVGPALDLFFSALENTDRFEVLSRPSVFALNNTKSMIAVGQRIAIPTSTLSSVSGINQGNQTASAVTSNIAFEDVVLKLEVIPIINSESEVTLKVVQVNDDIVGSTSIGGNEVPTIGTQEIVASVVVPNGATVMLGGLVSESSREVKSGIPGLMHVPVLGRLFGSNSTDVDRREIVIFLTPQIINDPGELLIVNERLQSNSYMGTRAEDKDYLDMEGPDIKLEANPLFPLPLPTWDTDKTPKKREGTPTPVSNSRSKGWSHWNRR